MSALSVWQQWWRQGKVLRSRRLTIGWGWDWWGRKVCSRWGPWSWDRGTRYTGLSGGSWRSCWWTRRSDLCWRSCTWERRTRCRRRAVDLGGRSWGWNSGRRSNVGRRHHRVAARRLEQRRPRLVVLLPPRPRLVVLRRSGRRCLRVIGGRWGWRWCWC